MEINKILTEWYENEGRDLPWRHSSNPYNIWVSEIILQQTRVDQGRSYYERFLNAFPDIFSLSRAGIDEVLKIWQGLGYYSRARNMHHTAGVIVRDYGGKFPGDYQSLLTLKGIGPYTAAAISSIAFGEAVPAIDGNIKRVISRLFGIDGDIKSSRTMKEIRMVLDELIDKDQPGKFNQAMMDLGALTCTPLNPSCPQCPLRTVCFAFQHDEIPRLPVNVKKTRIRKRYFYYCIIRKGENVYLQQRKGNDIWHLLYQFPLIESPHELSPEEIIQGIREHILNQLPELEVGKISRPISHQLSHQKIIARFIHISINATTPLSIKGEYVLIPLADLDNYAIPRLIERYMEENPV